MKDGKVFRIESPKCFSVNPFKSGYADCNVIGLDTEAVNGNLYSIQLYSKELGVSEFIRYRGESEEEILVMIRDRCSLDKSTFIFAHNLEYDLGILFDKVINDALNDVDASMGRFGKMKYKVIYPHPVYMKVRDTKRSTKNALNPINFYFVDTFPFFRGSLSRISEKMNLPVKKLPRPEYLGQREPTAEEMPYFKKYSMIDAEAVYWLGKEFMKFHQEYDVCPKMTVSPASLSSKVFRRKFLKNPIPMPKEQRLNYLALKSYWGGRTEAFCGGTSDIKIYDYNSFYPYAMTKIFLPQDDDRWKYTSTVRSPFGFYRIKGKMPEMKVSPVPVKTQRLIFPVGKFDVVVTGFEANDIIEHAKEYEVMEGYYYNGGRDYSLGKYARHFYQKKKMIDKSDNPSQYTRTKLLLNSLYGKTIQLNQSYPYYHYKTFGDIASYGHRLEAGGMFHPVIASWITGFCRSELFGAMKDYEDSIMYCDTDSLGIHADEYDVRTDNRLGGLKLEGEGKATIIREKVYFVEGQVNKVAKHGFWGSDDQFKNYVKSSKNSYSVLRMVKLMESRKRGIKPFVFEEQTRGLNLQTSMKRANPRSIDFLNEFVWLDPIKQ
jgi:hypothetical protein